MAEHLGLTIKRMAGKEPVCHREVLVAPTGFFVYPIHDRVVRVVTTSPDLHSPGPMDADSCGS